MNAANSSSVSLPYYPLAPAPVSPAPPSQNDVSITGAKKIAKSKAYLCRYPNCRKFDAGKGFCVGHGGGRHCEVPGCSKAIQGKGSRCKSHGGGALCSFPECTKKVVTKGLCYKHGGGKRCANDGCGRPARGVGQTLCFQCSSVSADSVNESQTDENAVSQVKPEKKSLKRKKKSDQKDPEWQKMKATIRATRIVTQQPLTPPTESAQHDHIPKQEGLIRSLEAYISTLTNVVKAAKNNYESVSLNELLDVRIKIAESSSEAIQELGNEIHHLTSSLSFIPQPNINQAECESEAETLPQDKDDEIDPQNDEINNKSSTQFSTAFYKSVADEIRSNALKPSDIENESHARSKSISVPDKPRVKTNYKSKNKSHSTLIDVDNNDQDFEHDNQNQSSLMSLANLTTISFPGVTQLLKSSNQFSKMDLSEFTSVSKMFDTSDKLGAGLSMLSNPNCETPLFLKPFTPNSSGMADLVREIEAEQSRLGSITSESNGTTSSMPLKKRRVALAKVSRREQALKQLGELSENLVTESNN